MNTIIVLAFVGVIFFVLIKVFVSAWLRRRWMERLKPCIKLGQMRHVFFRRVWDCVMAHVATQRREHGSSSIEVKLESVRVDSMQLDYLRFSVIRESPPNSQPLYITLYWDDDVRVSVEDGGKPLASYQPFLASLLSVDHWISEKVGRFVTR